MEAISSSGVRASEGSSACSAGRTSVVGQPDDCGEHEDQNHASGEEGDRRSGERAAADERIRKQKPLAAKAVAERRCERGDERSGQHPHDAGNPDADRPALVVREDPEGDEVRPLGGDRRPPRKLDTPQVLVAQDIAKSDESVNCSPHTLD